MGENVFISITAFSSIAASAAIVSMVMATASALQQVFLVPFEEEKKHEYHRRWCMLFYGEKEN